MVKKRGSNKKWRDWFENIMIAIFLALLVRTFIITSYKIPSTSMAPTLLPGDLIFSLQIPYGVRLPISMQKIGASEPERGDVVVFSYADKPQTTYVKRVVGLPGDRVEIKKNRLYINDRELEYIPSADDAAELPYVQAFKEKNAEKQYTIYWTDGQLSNFGPIVVPPGEMFVLGDNRDASDDSRYWGTVPVDRVEGKVVLIWFSSDWKLKWGGNKIRWSRMLKRVN